MVLTILFWILLILSFLAAILPDGAFPHMNKSRWIVALILIAILGYYALGNPVHR